jgi:cytochrome P450
MLMSSDHLIHPLSSSSFRRTCPGKKFSEMELTILTIKLIHAYKIEYTSPFEKQFELVLAPRGPVDIKFTSRY